MSRILRFFALVAVVFFSVNAFAGDPYGSCSAKKVYTDCAKGYVLQNGECVPDSSGSCSAGQYWDGSACQTCPSTHPRSEAGASSISECSKSAELIKNGGSGTCFGKTGTLDGAFYCYYGSTCTLPSWNSSSCNMTNGSKIFKGWSLSATATTGTTGDFVHGNTYYAVWVTPSCNITNGSGEVISALNNKPRCEVTCDSGYGTSGTYTGSAGGTNITFACTPTSNTCSAGQYWNGSACKECTSGYYCPGGTWTGSSVQGRESCPDGYGNSAPGSVDESDCYLTTTAGKYVATPESAETTCAENGYCPGGIDVYYGDTDGRMACTANSSSDAGSDAISDCKCNAGYGGNAGVTNGTCTICAAGTYKTSSGNTSCSACTAGYYCTGGTNQTACTANSSSPAGSDEISDCQCNAGYGGNAGTTNGTCTICVAGTYKTRSGNGSCSTCTAGYYCTGGTNRTACTANSSSVGGADAISDCQCNAGYGGNAGVTGGTCTICAAGTYKTDSGNSSCSTCTEGYYCTGGTNNQTACPDGYENSAPGSVAESNCYMIVPAGSYMPTAGSTVPFKCPRGTSSGQHEVNYGNTSQCSSCAPGSYTPYDGATCAVCPAGYYCSGDGRATKCPALYTNSSEGSDAATDCYTNTLTGQYIATPRAEAVTDCQAGTIAAAHTVYYGETSQCLVCKTNQWSGDAAGSCQACPTGWTNDGETAADHAYVSSCKHTVAAGYWYDSDHWYGSNDEAFIMCADGTYSEEHLAGWGVSTSCESCNTGYTNNSNHTACVAVTYTVQYNANGGSGSTASSSHTYGVAKTLTANGFTRTGYTFAGWATSASGDVVYANQQSVTNLASTQGATVNLYAKWTANNYSISLSHSPYSTPGTATLYTTYGTNVYLDSNRSQAMTTSANPITKPTLTGYTFGGYYSGSGGTGTEYIDVNGYITSAGLSAGKKCASSSCIWYVRWTVNTYTVSFDANGGTGGQTDTVTVTYGGDMPEISTTPPTRTGYYFNGWYDAETGGTMYYTANGRSALWWNKAADATLYAQWTANNSFINLHSNWATNSSGTATLYTTYDTNVYLDSNRSQAMTTSANPITKPTRDGYTFGGYYSGSGGTGTEYINANGYITSAGLSAGKECIGCYWYARWIGNTYTVSFDANGGTGGQTDPVTATYGSAMPTISTTAPTRTGYSFAGWYDAETGGTMYYTGAGASVHTWDKTADTTLYAQWNAVNYSIHLNPGSGYTTFGTRYLYTTYVTNVYLDSNRSQAMTTSANPITKPTKTGYTFAGYYSGSGGTGTEYINADGYITSAGLSAGKECVTASGCIWHAKWIPDCYQITLDNTTNGGTGGTTVLYKPHNSTLWYSDSSCSTQVTTITKPTKTNASYGSHYTRTSSGGYQYIESSGSLLSRTVTGPITLYARYDCNTNWRGSGTNISGACTGTQSTVSFDANGGTGGQTSNVTATYGSEMPEISTTPPTRTGYRFTGWYDAQTGGTLYYNIGGTSAHWWDKTENTTLYAQWAVRTYVCTSGQYLNVTSCERCTAGYYCPSSSATYTYNGSVQGRTACGDGKYSSAGATSCSNITAGCYGTSASSSCPAVCAANTYSNAGASACTSCDSDYANSGTDAASHAGVASCKVTCAAGTYVASANAACTDVGSGYYTTASQTISQGSIGSRSACSSLNAFYTASDSGRNATTDCYGTTSSGKYVSTAKSGEVTCAAGGYCAGSVKVYYNSTGGRTACGAGKYNASTGSSASSACTNITAGCYGTSASSSCPTVCAANTYSDAGASSCSSCPTDYKNSGDTAASHAGSASCKITVSGGYYIGTAGDNSSNWDKCACGTYKASHTVAYGSTSSCATTDAGYYAAAGASSQTKATAGYYAAAGACSQTACSGRTKYSAAGAASCSTVSTGYYTTGCNSSSNACTSQTICAKGTYCSSGVAYNCPGGTYGSTTGLSTNACSGKCTAGYYCPAGSTSATQNACATNATSAAGSDAISDCVCKAGYSGDASTSSGTCTACACGYYKGSTGNTSCTKTTAGYYATGTGNTGQTKATAGNYAAAGACSQSSCADLGGGLYSSSAAGSDAASDCYATVPATKYLSSSTSTGFTTCTAGYYCPGKTLYYASTGGRTACGGGKYSEAGSDASSDCKTISAGCYGSSAGSACPNTCAPGSYSTGGASGCTICGNKPTNSSYTDATGNTSADCPWTCNDGYNQTSDNQCGQFCTAGITHIKSSNGLSVPLYSSARTSPAINVKVNDSVCYGSLATGQSSGALNVRVGSTTYHSIN